MNQLNKEVVVPLNKGNDKNGMVIYFCQRCNNVFRYNIRHVQYCKMCGQHIAPYAQEVSIERQNFLKTIKEEDIK